jgi:chromosome partitioning protein
VKFELHFRYQLEERLEHAPDRDSASPSAARPSTNPSVTRQVFFCSQRCLEASHKSRADGLVRCDACAASFEVTLAAQVLFTGGRRHYACRPECRARILEGARAVRLGQLLDPRYALVEEATANTSSESQVEEPGADGSSERRGSPSAASDAEPPRSAASPLSAASRTGDGRPRVLAIFNHKGGTGKTTTAVHVAAGLAAQGQRVLLIDTDGQGNVATSLGLKFERSLYHVIVMGLAYQEAMVPARPGLHVVPSNETLAAAELYLAGQRQRDRVLASRFSAARSSFDFIVVDCSPSLSLMNQNALVMADAVLCPVACDYLSIVGVQKVVRTIKQVNRILSHPLTFWGVLPTMFDTRARICHDALDTLREHFGPVCLDPVHLAIRVKEAPAHGKTLFEYAPTSSAAQDYARVVERLLGADEAARSLTLKGVA